MTAGTASTTRAPLSQTQERPSSTEHVSKQQSKQSGPPGVESPNIQPMNESSTATKPSATNAPSTNLKEIEPLQQCDSLTVLQQDKTAPLRECVRIALRYYLHNMDGHDINDLYRMVLDEVERPLIETVMENTNNNQSVAARMLGMSRGTLRKKLKTFDQA
jgi:Fis family transcriptional regulator, factor for inversion stimulation protein